MSPEPTTTIPELLPAFAEAPWDSALNQLDHLNADLEAAREESAADQRYVTEKRALALLRGEPDPFPPDDEPLETAAADPEYRCEVVVFKAGHFAELRSGERPAMTMRRLDFDSHAGAYVSRTQRYGGQWSEPRVVAFAQTRPARVAQLPQLPRVRRGSSRAGRPGFRRTVAQSRAGPGDDDGGSEPPGRSTASSAGVWRLSAHHGLTPASFHEEAERFLTGVASDRVGATKARIFASLPPGLQRAFWVTLGAELNSERMRVGADTWAPRRGAGLAAELEQSEAKGGAA
jgi:hypothetical protein